ncbi:MAG: tetratricopeptide repeat protein [Alphaproteobacteria bacterium]|nr:tetratricopeptide repeat protein [Alphaproteobacteria bacterium]MBV9373278.1 tetratricopeptide repeat protein [Alphaproteobacteria bacterium]MBV9901241.1 tetratricopeptide repeat protein [Alphaproteobacteria bacterium]
MRYQLIAAVALAGAAWPAAAQRPESPEKRIERLEQELRAVQRRVFQGNGPYVDPEISPQAAAPGQAGVPATSAVADLTARLDSIEGQLRVLTGQAEENGNRLRVLEGTAARLQESVGARLDALEKSAAATPAASVPAEAAEQPARASAPPRPGRRQAAAPAPADTGTPDWVSARDEAVSPGAAAAGAEAAYNAGYRLWEQKRYSDAVRALEDVVRTYPRDRWASWAGNLAGRAYLDDGKPTAAAKAFLANYQSNPRGERAADSLYFLGQSLMTLKKPADACKAYDELQDVYGQTMRDWLRQRLPAARADAGCR